MRKLAVVLFVTITLLFATVAGMQVAGDIGPGGNGSNPFTIQTAGDIGPGGNG